jgi:hypothetical protein
MILLVQAYDANGLQLTLEDGAIIPDYGGIGKPEEGYYAGLPGKIYAKILTELWTEVSPSGAYWNPVRIASDNRLSAMEADTSTFSFASPAGVNFSVSVKLLYRRAFIELMDQKGWDVPDILMVEKQITLP